MSKLTPEVLLVKEVMQLVITIFSMILDSAESMGRKIDEIIEKTATIKRIEGEATAQNRKICKELQFAIQKSQTYMATVMDLKVFTTDQRRLERIYEQVRQDPPNYQPLTEYINDIQRCLQRVTQLHREFSESCNAALLNAQRGEAYCAEQQKKQTAKKRTTQVVGGTATAATLATGIGTGVVLSVVAGVFTFGIGTVVGLGATAAGATAGGLIVGSAGAAATALIADHFKESEEAFRKLKESYKTLQTMGSNIQLDVNGLQQSLQRIGANVADVIHSRDNHETPEYTLNILQASLAQLNPRTH